MIVVSETQDRAYILNGKNHLAFTVSIHSSISLRVQTRQEVPAARASLDAVDGVLEDHRKC
jgi:hypothetical protein